MDFTSLASVLGGGSYRAGRAGFSSVCIDSREAKPGALFAALEGSVQDGHRYVEAAFRAGAAGALVLKSRLEDPVLGLRSLADKYEKTLISVDNTLSALQGAAKAYLGQFPALLKIGITGSSGKTTTKEIASAIIGREKSVVMNPGNLNSETGLPLAVFNIRGGHEAAVLEMGMNRRGEISELTDVFPPDIALITNIGTAHIGILGSRGAIVEEKKKIFSRFTGKETALIPEDEEYRKILAEGVKGTVRYYGRNTLEGLGEIKDLGLRGASLFWEGKEAFLSLPGPYNVRNALAAIAIARELSVSGRAVREGLASVKPLFGRGEILEGEVTVLRDCYNSNPESAAAAVGFCDSLSWRGRRVYVMADMLELGAESVSAHRELGKRLASSRAERIFLYGKEMEAAAEVLAASRKASPAWSCTRDMAELERTLESYVRSGDLVLLKGSRGCALEQLTDLLIKQKERVL
jgi:UDP-N-acetylmuramoyl-tripeptide--D-alanyl-D-alanine ligase